MMPRSVEMRVGSYSTQCNHKTIIAAAVAKRTTELAPKNKDLRMGCPETREATKQHNNEVRLLRGHECTKREIRDLPFLLENTTTDVAGEATKDTAATKPQEAPQENSLSTALLHKEVPKHRQQRRNTLRSASFLSSTTHPTSISTVEMPLHSRPLCWPSESAGVAT